MTEEETVSSQKSLLPMVSILVVIGIIAIAAFYYFSTKGGGYSANQTTQNTPTYQAQQTQAPSQTTNPISGVPSDNIYLTKTDAVKGQYITDFAGMALYIFDKDKPGVSNCYNTCATNWPPYTSGATAQKQFPANITTVKRTDGSMQFAWKGMPLYYFAADKKAGDLLGDGVGGIWHLVKP